jgi:site-specific recombinase XerD
MPLYQLDSLCAGLESTAWGGLIRDWDRSLKSANHPETTRYNYLLAVAQLARYLNDKESEYAGTAPALDPAAVKKRHVEAFQGWMIETRSANTALNKHKGLQQFFKWLVGEEEIETSPMARMTKPKTEEKLIPVMRDWETKS